MVLTFELSAGNENDVSLPLRQMTYDLELDGKRVFSGTRSPEATLTRLRTHRVTLPAVVRVDESRPRPTGVVPYRLRGTLTYVTPGAFAETLFDAGVRRPTVDFSENGSIDFGDGRSDPVLVGTAR